MLHKTISSVHKVLNQPILSAQLGLSVLSQQSLTRVLMVLLVLAPLEDLIIENTTQRIVQKRLKRRSRGCSQLF